MRTRSLVAAVLTAGALLTAPAGAVLAQSPLPGGGAPLTATLTGAAEAPAPGDPDGRGSATITLNPGLGEVCFALAVSAIILPATAAHIHVGPAGVAGPVVVGLAPPTANGTSSGCVTADRDLILAIIQNPELYYVNVHNADFPAGAVRGQLEPLGTRA